MSFGTTVWIMGCSHVPGRPAPPILEVSGWACPIATSLLKQTEIC